MQQDSKGRQVAAWDARQRDRKDVGLDVHKATIAVAVADEGRGEVRKYGTITNSPAAVAKLVKRLGSAERLVCCYEAGPCGYGLQRQLAGLGVACTVVAPSLIPTRPGDRVKTAQREAVHLAQPLPQVVLVDAIETVDAGTARVQRLEGQLKQAATVGRHAPLIAALQSLRGAG